MTIIQSLVVILFLVVFSEANTHATQFVYNGFHGGGLKLSGSADIFSSGLLQLTDMKTRVLGHAFHSYPLHFKNHTFSFSTTFVFSIDPEYPDLGGHGMALVITPFPDLPGALPSQFLGLLNSSTMGKAFNHLFAVEFDTVRDFEFEDRDDNHVGININTLVSAAFARPEVCLKGGENIQAWIDVHDAGSNHKVDVFVAIAGSGKPPRPLLSAAIDLSAVILKDDVYVGFSAGTGLLTSKHRVMGWSFNTNGTAADLDLDLVLPPGKRGRQLVIIFPSMAAAVLFCGVVSVLVLSMRKLRDKEVEEWELELAPRRFTYSELEVATKGFKELVGSGGFGRVYRGVLNGGQEVAVKRVAQDSKQGLREFAAEISTIGRLRHRNLVKLHGYCRRQRKAELLLVYDYMPNGSLDRQLFFTGGGPGLSWERRLDILKGVAAALLYIHEEWESRVVHRDVKASNVLLDGKFNARLGDFGLARLYDHGKNAHTTKAVGTLGYVAPELVRTGKATPSSDVFSYGALLLEVACGRRPVEPWRCEEEMVLVEWVWGFQERGEVLLASDPRLFCGGDGVASAAEEVEVVLKLGLLCSHVVPERRPSMRQVVQILNGDAPLPQLTPKMPVIEHPPPPMLQGFKRNVSG